MNIDKIVEKLIACLIENVSDLSKSKHSGVHDNGNTYRVHYGTIVPKFLDQSTTHAYADVSKAIEKTLLKNYTPEAVQWDASSLWLTIKK